MTTAGDVGSGNGTEPMIKYGTVNRREKPYKKIKSFKEYIIYTNLMNEKDKIKTIEDEK